MEKLALQAGSDIAGGELIGLVPEEACGRGQTEPLWMRQIPGFRFEDKVLERRLEQPMNWPEEL